MTYHLSLHLSPEKLHFTFLQSDSCSWIIFQPSRHTHARTHTHPHLPLFVNGAVQLFLQPSSCCSQHSVLHLGHQRDHQSTRPMLSAQKEISISPVATTGPWAGAGVKLLL